MAVDTKWFRDRLADKRMSQRALAKALGLDAAAVSLTFRGRREMKLSEAASIAQLLGTPMAEVLEHAGVRTDSMGTRISVSAIIDEHQEVHTIPRSETFDVAMPGGITGECMAIQARTPGADDGWIYFVRAPSRVNPEAIGRFSFVKAKNGITTLAKVSRGYRPGRFKLAGPVSGDDVELEWAEPVLLIQP